VGLRSRKACAKAFTICNVLLGCWTCSFRGSDGASRSMLNSSLIFLYIHPNHRTPGVHLCCSFLRRHSPEPELPANISPLRIQTSMLSHNIITILPLNISPKHWSSSSSVSTHTRMGQYYVFRFPALLPLTCELDVGSSAAMPFRNLGQTR
jgi:hypothetical protein